jgi:predicted tellurium resistance membrane protein TerC
MELLSPTFLAALAQIMLVNIVLSGDNAVVIALAARNLPPQHQKTAILWGSGGAIVLRVVLTVVAVELLKIPYL